VCDTKKGAKRKTEFLSEVWGVGGRNLSGNPLPPPPPKKNRKFTGNITLRPMHIIIVVVGTP